MAKWHPIFHGASKLDCPILFIMHFALTKLPFRRNIDIGFSQNIVPLMSLSLAYHISLYFDLDELSLVAAESKPSAFVRWSKSLN